MSVRTGINQIYQICFLLTYLTTEETCLFAFFAWTPKLEVALVCVGVHFACESERKGRERPVRQFEDNQQSGTTHTSYPSD